ncbi:ras family-domain-containing protein [Pisolithus croceorrhizus]|nr:ras family-domain-containing protein [Pisolithus croceorrhizus]
MQVDGRHVKLGIRDTAGMERFRSITAAYYRDVQGVILVYNITDATSFNALPGWLAEIENYIPSSVPKMIVGNKLDQEHSREVDTSEGELFASYSGALFREAGAQTLVGVTEVFEDLVKEMLDAEDRRDPTDTARRGPDNELVESCANERPKRGWWGKCSC